MDKCISCGSEMVEGAKFCIICGSVVKKENHISEGEKEQKREAAVAEDAEMCSSCKAPLRKGAKFCVSCGTVASDTAEQQTAAVDEISKKKEAEKPAAAKEEKPAAAKEEKPAAAKTGKSPKKPSKKEAAIPAVEKSDEAKPVRDESWEVLTGEQAAREVEALDMLVYGQGIVSKISFKKVPKSSNLVVHGKVKCNGCKKLSLFTLDCNRGWGGSNDPTTCPCGRKVEVGEYWSDADDAIFVWASTEAGGKGIDDYPLSVSISRVVGV